MPAARRTPRTHRNAVTRMLRVTGLLNVPEEAPLVALVKELAREMDEGGGTRARADYLSALKDVRRVLNMSEGRPRKSADPAPTSKTVQAAEALVVPAAEPQRNDLARFKEKHGVA